MTVSVNAGELRIGRVLASPVCDADGTKLLSAGVEITESFLRRLRSRGISAVSIGASDVPLLRESNGAHSDISAAAERSTSAPSDSRPLQLLRALGNLARRGNAANLNLDLIQEGALLLANSVEAEYYAYATPRSEDRQSFYIGHCKDNGPVNCYEVPREETESFAGFMQNVDEVVLIDDLFDETRFSDHILDRLRLRTCCAAPIRIDGCPVGTIAALTTTQRKLHEYDRLLADTVAEIVALGSRGGDWGLQKQLDPHYEGGDRRRHKRFQYIRTLNLAPFREGNPPGWDEYQMVVCTDLSVSGFCYLDRTEPPHEFLFVGLGAPPAVKYLKAKVKNVRPTHVNGWPMFAIGCSLLGRIDFCG